MGIEIREPPVLVANSESQQLHMWLQELRQKLVEEIDAIRALGPLIATNPQIIYWGNPGTNGTWRLIRTGNNFAVERREEGIYVEKFLFEAV